MLVGPETFDDAGAIQLTGDLVLLQTADVISPVSDDPYVFGQVAAANSLSDIYAMGGRPVSALNLAFFPREMPCDQERELLRGAADKCAEAGAVVLGGHTVRDPEVKFGLAVAGTCRPGELLRNTGARPGDSLVLTKPIGTGLLLTAMQKGWLGGDELAPLLRNMAALNDVAAEQAVALGAHAATDITGFGLGGHAAEMTRGSCVRLRIEAARVPRYPQALDLLDRGARTAITADNLASMRRCMPPSSVPDERTLKLLADPQTSGGLLVSIPADAAPHYVERLRNQGIAAAAIVGEVLEATEPELIVTPL